jgi:hypothetical protein
MGTFHRVDTGQLIRGAARLMYALSTQAKPTKIGDVVKTASGSTQYDAQTGWLEDSYDVDQINGDILTSPNTWTGTVTTNLAEMTLEHELYVLEGLPIVTNTITLDAPNGVAAGTERVSGAAGASSYTERRLAVLFKRANDKLKLYAFHRSVRSPQETTITFAKGGDAQTVAARWNLLQDATEADPRSGLYKVIEQT